MIFKKEPDKISIPFSSFLDAIRWISAFLVLLGHMRYAMFIDYNQVKDKDILTSFFYLISTYPHQAVMIFFVLSGYLVGGSVIKDFQKDNLDFKAYSINRISRLYIAFIPALFLTVILDFTGLSFFNINHIYNNCIDNPYLNSNVPGRLNLEYLLKNFFMLQYSYSSTFGSNGVLWSLAYEFWYYFIFFFMANIFYPAFSLKKKIIFAVLIILSMSLVNKTVILYFSIWLIGAGIHFLKPGKKSLLFILIPVFALIMYLIKIKILPPYYIDLLFAVTTAFIINCAKNNAWDFLIKTKNINKKLADFSYSLYIIHFPLFIFLLALINTLFNFQIKDRPESSHYLIFITLFAFIYIVSYLFSLVTEARTQQLRNLINRLFRKPLIT